MEPLTKEELLRKYPENEMRVRILQLAALSDILGNCLITNAYKPPVYLNESFKLTSYGEAKVQGFLKKRIPYAEARLICLLEYTWIDLLVDPITTKIQDIRSAISRQIIERSVYFPFIFGRYLYDRAFEQLDLTDGTTSINLAKTLDFLDDTPQGVFQHREFITGPFGLLTSEQIRFFPPDRGASLMHCSDVNCAKIHRVEFSTGHDAPINKHRNEAMKTLIKESEDPSAWGSFISDLLIKELQPARDHIGNTLIPILGDCLTDEEMRALTAWLLDRTKGRLRQTAEKVGLRGRATDIVENLGRAEMMQLCLTMDDRSIANGIDSLTYEGGITVPKSESRLPKVVMEGVVGDFDLISEIGPYGVRSRSVTMNIAPLRLRNLVEAMYRLEDVGDREELDWKLRGEEGNDLEARLESYLQNRSPRDVISKLAIARRSNAVTACELLGLRDGAIDDPDFVSLILWKLGFGAEVSDEAHADFWRLHDKLEQLTRQGPAAPRRRSVEEFRGVAVNYFVNLEELLTDSLAFVTWALTHDHCTDRQPFVYRADKEVARSFAWLNEAVARSSESILQFGAEVSLHALCRGFQVLASELRLMQDEHNAWSRLEEEIPDWTSQQNLQKFPFRHTVPFLDLTDESRRVIIDQLHEISRTLVRAEVPDNRNRWAHGGREIPEQSRVREVLAAVKDAVQLIEDGGFARVRYFITSRESDGYGRSVVTLSNAKGFAHKIRRPTQYDWLKLPAIDRGVHVMSAACFAAPDHYLRFRSENPSPFSELWADFPKRKPRSQRTTRPLEGLRTTGNVGLVE